VVLRLGITTAVAVPVMTWVVMPRVTRLLRGWLHPDHRPRLPTVRSQHQATVRNEHERPRLRASGLATCAEQPKPDEQEIADGFDPYRDPDRCEPR
jgi:hypothetical protein